MMIKRNRSPRLRHRDNHGKSAATVIPAAFGLAGVNLHTYTGWGSVTYWNAYVANTQMHGKGTFFDGNSGFSFTLGAGQVIAGWDQGVAGMKVGGQRRLIIPPDLAYGSQGRSPIPPNATLIFDITLTGVQ